VAIGGGPVLRVGDKLSCFSSEVDCWFRHIAEDIAKGDKKFKFQRALLPGGRCEASVWTLAGRKIGGLAFPLGNYHNNGERGYAPEFVSYTDYECLQRLLLGISCAGPIRGGFDKEKKLLSDNYKKWKSFL
jgi:endoglucanase